MKTLKQFLEMKNDPCWKGYQMIGKKKKNGREVPNCVPVDEDISEGMFDKLIKRVVQGAARKTADTINTLHQSPKDKTGKPTERGIALPQKPRREYEFPKTEEYQIDEVAAWQRKEGKSESGGLNRRGIESYRRENPGSKLSLAVTTKPSKLKKGSKAWKRRKSFCSRMSGMKARLTSSETANDPDSRINKSLRKWNC